ncbi:5,10-methylene tetrahydromethanopterin reductase [Salegentibacter salinarum]|uniref:5,10-methylene tetrahydromethanopterin reductase n=1 Tax=Salegentibacter salinarum TaxID=447422 RepID=A0A2N0TNA5_9FLAO|nr:TIGR03885 family FMN-dependent LLM class oxidoreductase [Salegentibacter salinarum]PKD16229.1 5,10-methylene tetrahydromethanopterin reductase [Salegentibacter salinarum]SKB67701.1 probable non-F420 flavinoid oxidoreductase [Salegentibacter salinarum]
MKIGFHASHEQFTPRHLLELVQKAEVAGFESILSSDHFHPWSNQQGESGFAWSWLGAAMQVTNLEYGIVNAPGQRYHPAIIAQAASTLGQMFPGRFWLCQGSGQALNENITGQKWPSKELRNARLKESVQVIRELWKGDYVTHHGLINVEKAKLFTQPVKKIPVYGAAITSKTARWLGDWVDGLITVSKPLKELKNVVEAFKEGGGGEKPMVLKVQISYDENEEKALVKAWKQWKNNIFPSKLLSDINTADQFDDLGEKVRKEDLRKHVIIGNKPEIFISRIKEYQDLGFEKIIIHNVNKEQEKFIDFFGNEVLSSF